MNKSNLWLIGAIVLVVAIVAGGWFVGVQPQLAAAAAAESQRAQVVADNAQHQADLDKLKADYGQLPKLKADLAALRESIPTGSDLPSFVDQLNALYVSTGVSFVGYSTAAALPYTAVQAPAASAAPNSSGTPSPTPTPSGTPSPSASSSTPTSSSTPAPGAPPVTNALVTAQNFVATPLTVNIQGKYANILAFVDGIQSGKRLFLLTNLSTTQSTEDSAPGTFDATVTGLIYSMVDAASTPAAPSSAVTGEAATASK